jgi:hypothetical protein
MPAVLAPDHDQRPRADFGAADVTSRRLDRNAGLPRPSDSQDVPADARLPTQGDAIIDLAPVIDACGSHVKPGPKLLRVPVIAAQVE